MARWTTWHSHAQVQLRKCSFVLLYSPQISLNYLFYNFLSCDNSKAIVWNIKKSITTCKQGQHIWWWLLVPVGLILWLCLKSNCFKIKVWKTVSLVSRVDTFDGDCRVGLPCVLSCPHWQCGWTELRNIQNKKLFKMFDSHNITDLAFCWWIEILINTVKKKNRMMVVFPKNLINTDAFSAWLSF